MIELTKVPAPALRVAQEVFVGVAVVGRRKWLKCRATQGAVVFCSGGFAALSARKPKMVAAVALANKTAKMIWALSTKLENYRMA